MTLTTASMVCGEIDIDSSCAYRIAKLRRDNSRNLGPRPRLELAEAAILDDHYDVAHDWVDDVKASKTEFCERALTNFFDVWAEYGRGKPDHAVKKLVAWKTDNDAYWELPSSKGACWSFSGVRRKLGKMSASEMKTVVTNMLDSMTTKPVPPVTN